MNKKDKLNEAGIVLIAPTETQSSVKIYPAAGEIRVEVKVYSNDIDIAAKKASEIYDKYQKKYKKVE